MLVLSRKLQQQIRIDDRITVTILKTRGQTVRVGIEAPRDVKVVRAELAPLPECPQSRRSECPAKQSQERHPLRWSVVSMRLRTGSAQPHPEATAVQS